MAFGVHPNGAGFAEQVSIQSDGNVGIGTTSPSTLLHLSSSAASIRISSIAGGANLYLDNASGNNSRVRYNSSTGYFALRDDNASSDVFVISGSSGNVGIGTTSPSQKLHVKGNILVEDNDSTDTVAQIGNSGDDGWINLYANGVSKAFVGANTVLLVLIVNFM
jgi:hypothetical protein